MVITYQFNEVGLFSENLTAVRKNDKWGVIDKTGKVVADFQFDSIRDFRDGCVAVKQNGQWGFINNYGKIITDCEFDEVKDFSESLAAVMKNDKWGFIDTNGKIVIELKYDDVGNFSEGKAAVKLAKQEMYNVWTYIDKTDKIVIEPYSYDAAGGVLLTVGEFHDGLAFVTKTLLSIIDENGNNIFLGDSLFFISKPIYNKEFDAIPAYTYIDSAMKIRKYSLVGLNGKQRLEPVFDYVDGIYGEYVIVENIVDGEYKMGVIKITSK